MTTLLKQSFKELSCKIGNIGKVLAMLPTIGMQIYQSKEFMRAIDMQREKSGRVLDAEFDMSPRKPGYGKSHEPHVTIPPPNYPKKCGKMDFQEASEIYFKHLEATEPMTRADQPNALLSKLTNGIWYLRNGNGLLARVGTVRKRVFIPNRWA
jgi:hypothetical protein